jgi:tetratricopeptide (TPR) repeat protein
MLKLEPKKCFAALILVLLLLPTTVEAQKRSGAQVLPLPMRLVLFKVNPMLQKKEYARALKTLQAFQTRGGPAPEPGQPDAKGYHHPEIYFILGNCHLQLEQYAPAAAAYRQTVARDTTHTSAWLNLAGTYYEMMQYAKAGRCFAKAYTTAEVKTPEPLYYSAVAYLMADDHKRSIEIFEQLLTAHPAAVKPEWKENLIHALLAADQPRRALPYIRELAHTYSGDKQIQWQEILLYQYMQLEMANEARDLALNLTRQTPTVAKWWKALTHIQLNGGREEEALAALIVYAFLTPLSMEEKKLLADLNLQLGIPVKAVPIYETCLKKRPNKELLQRLILAYRQLGRPGKALERINTITLDPKKDTDLMMLKGEMLYSLKQFAAAASAYRQAAQSGGRHSGRAWLMAGYAAWQIDDISAGKDAFAQAAKYKRERKAAITALHQLSQSAVILTKH